MKNSVFIYSQELEKYRYPESCPFKTERTTRTRNILKSMDFYTGVDRIEVAPIPATTEELLLFHTPEYIKALQQVSFGQLLPEYLFMGIGTADTPVFPDLYNYAILASGGTIAGARLLLNGSASLVFNPSGGFHHALASKAGGFCYVNDVVLACKILVNAGKRVMNIDLDAHHGNGTQDAFYSDNRVFSISLHESGATLYPWGGFEDEVGEGAGYGYNMNVPFPAGCGDDIYYNAFRSLVPSLIKAYNPDIILLELGMDILSVDPLTHLSMTNNVIADILPLILQFEKPILALGSGGYSLEDTARGWALCWCTLGNITMEEDLYIGLGGTFLGSAEWNAGLRDRHVYITGNQKEQVELSVAHSVDKIKKLLFPIHNIPL